MVETQAFFADSNAAGAAVWSFSGSSVTPLTLGFVDQTTALEAIASLSLYGCEDLTPLAAALCEAIDYLASQLPTSSQLSRQLAIYTDGGENNSGGICGGSWSVTGPPPPGNYDFNSWQSKVWTRMLEANVLIVRFWSTVSYSPSSSVRDEHFFRDLAESTCGDIHFFADGATGGRGGDGGDRLMLRMTPDADGVHLPRMEASELGWTVTFTLDQPAPVRLSIHDIAGRRVSVVLDDFLGAGEHSVNWRHGLGESKQGLAPGVYLYRLAIGGEQVASGKFVHTRR